MLGDQLRLAHNASGPLDLRLQAGVEDAFQAFVDCRLPDELAPMPMRSDGTRPCGLLRSIR
jgi:hypothetical protein